MLDQDWLNQCMLRHKYYLIKAKYVTKCVLAGVKPQFLYEIVQHIRVGLQREPSFTHVSETDQHKLSLSKPFDSSDQLRATISEVNLRQKRHCSM